MIRLDSIKIERFRGIRSGEVSGFVDVNLMIGRNNCGKSTVAEAITLAMVGPFFGSSAIAPPSAQGALPRRALDTWIIERREQNLRVPEIWYGSDTSNRYMCDARLMDNVGEQVFRSAVAVDAINGVKEIHRTGPSEAGRFMNEVKTFVPSDAARVELENAVWQQLLTLRKDKALVAAINDVFGLNVEQLNLPPSGRMMLLFPDRGLPVDVHGDGTRAVLRTLIVLASMQGTLFIMEEPECHQHPGSLEKFTRAVCNLAKSQSVQLLITTHSIECVKAFLAAAEECGSESAVFHLTLDDGELTSRKLDAETVESLQATGVDVRTLDLYV